MSTKNTSEKLPLVAARILPDADKHNNKAHGDTWLCVNITCYDEEALETALYVATYTKQHDCVLMPFVMMIKPWKLPRVLANSTG